MHLRFIGNNQLYCKFQIEMWPTNLSETYRDGLAIVTLIIRDAPPEVHIAEEHPSIKAHLLEFVEHLLDEDLPLCSEIEEGARDEDSDLSLLPRVRSGWVLGDVVISGDVISWFGAIGLWRGGEQLWRFCWWNWVFERRISKRQFKKRNYFRTKVTDWKRNFRYRRAHYTCHMVFSKTKNKKHPRPYITQRLLRCELEF